MIGEADVEVIDFEGFPSVDYIFACLVEKLSLALVESGRYTLAFLLCEHHIDVVALLLTSD